MEIPEKLQSACNKDGGRDFLSSCVTIKEAWETCKNSSWMFWAIRKLEYDNIKQLILLSCEIVQNTPIGDGRYTAELLTDQRSRDGIAAAIKFAHGKITIEEMRVFADAANVAAATAAISATAAYYATYCAAYYATYCAAYYASYDASNAAATAASTARSAAKSAYYAANSAAAADAASAAICDMIREFISFDEIEKLI
jgi:hypothetical protein